MLFDLDFDRVNWFWLVIGILITSYAMTGMGMFVGASGLIGTDINFLMNLIFAILIVLCGVNFPISLLPEPLQIVSNILPLTHGLEAVRQVFDGSLARVPGLLLTEFALGSAYIAGGYGVFRWSEYKARVLGTLDLT